MQTNRRLEITDRPQQNRPMRSWNTRRRHALLSSALRGAAYATGAGIVGLVFWWIQHRL